MVLKSQEGHCRKSPGKLTKCILTVRSERMIKFVYRQFSAHHVEGPFLGDGKSEALPVYGKISEHI
jgi:hypothetical protein